MENIKGTISSIIYQNEENGYTISHLQTEDDKITIVGCMPTLSLGETIIAEGIWVSHDIYGIQFKVASFLPATPSSIDGILVYLSSGMIKGVGKKVAEKIVDKFGVSALEVIQMNPERLCEVEGIGTKKAKQIGKSFEDSRELRNIIIYLSKYGITPAYCLKIHRRYKHKALDIVNKNPYKLAEDITGIGFKIADNIAQNMGIDKNSYDRICQGILHMLRKSLNDGHTFLPNDILVNQSKELLEVEEKDIKECIKELEYNKKIKIESNINDVHIYLMPYYIAENGVCTKLIKLSRCDFEDIKITVESKINDIEKENEIKLGKKQKEAVQDAINEGVLIITGGPGTGKTTTINTIIQIFEDVKKKVVLAAPTGRAAKRMSETSSREAKTIHRLLEIGYSKDDESLVFLKGEDDPIDADVIIIDEISMVDVILMYNLLKSIKEKTRIIMVGDSDQLPSVGAGNILKDIIESKAVKVVKLDEIFRQAKESMIVVNAHKINKGQMPILNSKDKDFFFIKKLKNEDILNEILDIVNNRLPNYYNIDKLKDIQVLAPMRKSELGVFNLNNYLQNVLNPPNNLKEEEVFQRRIFRVGDKVMQIKNNYSRKWISLDAKEKGEGIYNGDIGYICRINKEEKIILVMFEEYKVYPYDYNDLDELEHSFCTTIHKSQGSEFPVVVMPISWAPPMLLTRNLLYTGITRAKKLVVLVGDSKYLSIMIKNDKINKRYSGLKNKLAVF